MSAKSQVVCFMLYTVGTAFQMCYYFQVGLGIIMKNENVTDEMIDILQDLSQYVPHKQVNQDAINEGPPTVNYHNILFGGDQVTAARARSAIRMHQNSETESGKLKGFIPIVEDWHAKVALLGVSTYLQMIGFYNELYSLRWCGHDCTVKALAMKRELYFS